MGVIFFVGTLPWRSGGGVGTFSSTSIDSSSVQSSSSSSSSSNSYCEKEAGGWIGEDGTCSPIILDIEAEIEGAIEGGFNGELGTDREDSTAQRDAKTSF